MPHSETKTSVHTNIAMRKMVKTMSSLTQIQQ